MPEPTPPAPSTTTPPPSAVEAIEEDDEFEDESESRGGRNEGPQAIRARNPRIVGACYEEQNKSKSRTAHGWNDGRHPGPRTISA